MSDPVSLGLGAIAGINHAMSIARTLSDVRDQTQLLHVRAELLSLLVEAQTAQLALVQEKQKLAERISQLEAWNSERERYELTSIGRGTFAFALKADAARSEPAHMACANCFKQGHASILQSDRTAGHGAYSCPRCKAVVTPHSDRLREIGVLPKLDPS